MLAQILYNHFKMISSRINVFSGIIKSLMLCRGSKYKNMAEEQIGDILLDSKIKSVSRFLEGNHIDDDNFYQFMSSYIPDGKALLSIDRTIWELGKEIRNILVLAVSYEKIAMPLIFKIIPYKGSCTADDQVELIQKFIDKFGIERIEAVTGDREFDNEKLISFLNAKNISYALRVRKTNRVINECGERVKISGLGNNIRNFSTKFYSVEIKFDHIRLPSGDFLSIVSNRGKVDALELYRKRWDIESGFKGCKTSGFRMEDTHIKKPKRFKNFIKCLFIAYAISIKTGYYEDKDRPIKTKVTLVSKAYSVLQYGLKALKQAYCRSKELFETLINTILSYVHL